MDSETLTVFAVCAFFVVGLLGEIYDRIVERKDWRDNFFARYCRKQHWFMTSYEHDGLHIIMRDHPDKESIESFRQMTEFVIKHNIPLKRYEVTELLKREKRPEVIAMAKRWPLERER